MGGGEMSGGGGGEGGVGLLEGFDLRSLKRS